ncbi:VirK family virulence factor [Buttiauxella brennerae ATCC 51605]|uniref:VirK family virulence factor n=1 Tax=Buttiauxella brennerae ATCC 51605 TaxID=1354251 RepID=A0A1B7IRE4_9ENTR|nr:VirK/YbjX family protein [Buttiauxella brennerae]OAT32356.1 VirK family virulence factor [Buttiauxella brennerae ATCC 51605]
MTILDQHPSLQKNNAGVSTIMALINGSLAPCDIWHEKSYRAKFLLRTLLAPRQTLRFFNSMAQQSYFSTLLKAQKTLPSKIHRHYLHLGMNASARVDAILSHYQFIEKLGCKTLARGLMSPEQTVLLELSGKDGEKIEINASTALGAEREGESTLWLNMNGVRLAALTFCVSGDKIFIGGLQGAHRSVPHETIKTATKACYGLFPKRLLMEVLWLLAAQQGIKGIFGVSNEGHVFRGLRYRLSKGKHFHASYDEFWQSTGGEQYGKHLYRLPLSLPQKDLSEIASKKRSEYRKRYSLLEELQTQFAELR